MAAEQISMVIQTTSDTGTVDTYRSPGSDSAYSAVQKETEYTATQISEDGLYYFVPTLGAWIKAENVIIVKDNNATTELPEITTKQISTIIQTVSDDDDGTITTYRSPKTGEAYSTISKDKVLTATMISEDGKYYFVPTLGAWIKSGDISVVKDNTPTSSTTSTTKKKEPKQVVKTIQVKGSKETTIQAYRSSNSEKPYRKVEGESTLTATQESADGKYYYIPALGAWIETDKATVLEDNTNVVKNTEKPVLKQVHRTIRVNGSRESTTQMYRSSGTDRPYRTVNGSKSLTATMMTEDGSYYFIPSLGAWIESNKVTLVSMDDPVDAKSTTRPIHRAIRVNGDTDMVYLYRALGYEESYFSTIPNHVVVLATMISEDGNYYYIASQKAWIKTDYVIDMGDADAYDINELNFLRVEGFNIDWSDRIIANRRRAAGADETMVDTLIEYDTASEENYTENNRTTGYILSKINTDPTSTGSIKTRAADVDEGIRIPGKIKATGEEPLIPGTQKNGLGIDQNLTGIFGMPYQFSPHVDRRIVKKIGNTGYSVGRKFSEKILTRNNLVYFCPCVQDFMTGASEEDKIKVLTGLSDIIKGVNPSVAIESLKKYARYYTTKQAFGPYYNYVNPMCNAVAIYMGIGDHRIKVGDGEGTCGDFLWQNAVPKSMQGMLGMKKNVVFYADGLNSVSEDFTNDTRESSLASSINGLSDEAKEINFVTKSDLGSRLNYTDDNAAASSIRSMVDKFTNGPGVLQAVLDNASTLMAGGKILFPEMWGDSSYDRSYTINFKFRTPEADPVSIFLNILVPYIHLIALTAPKEWNHHDNTSNSYVEPFFVNCTFKGLFHVDMGLITALSSDRGSEGTWSIDGLPTQLDVSLTVKDLYKSLYISNGSNANRFVGNDGLTDYLMCLAGCNLALPTWDRKVAAYAGYIEHKYNAYNAVSRIGTGLQDEIARLLDKVFK